MRNLVWSKLGVLLAVCGPVIGEERVRLTTEHVDLWVVYQPDDPTNKLALVIRDDDHRVAYRSNQVTLVVAETARWELPGDFPPLGNAGDPLWILPQTQDPRLLYLGLSTEGVPTAVFPSGLNFYLRAVQGPGYFFAWQSGLGGLDVHWNSRDGLDESDLIRFPAGSHSHWNFGFTTNGAYDLVFEIQGRRAGVPTNDFSLLTPVRFEVEPLPPPAPTPFARWQREQWPGGTDPAIVGPEADPDGDGVVNAVEYALGLDPQRPDRHRLPRPYLVDTPAGRRLRLEFIPASEATDVTFLAWQTGSLTPPATWQRVGGPRVIPGGEGRQARLVFETPEQVTAANGFLHWAVQLTP